jgi:hypothetical protein
VFKIFSKHPKLWRDFSYYLGLFINLSILLSYRYTKEGSVTGEDNYYQYEYIEGIFTSLTPKLKYSGNENPMLFGIFYDWDVEPYSRQDVINYTK